MTAWHTTKRPSGFGHRLLLAVAALGLATALLLSQHGTARADEGFYRQASWNWAYNTQWDWNWDRGSRRDRNWNSWDDDWYASRGTWGNYGLWYGQRRSHGTPVIYTFDKPVYLPQYGRWVVFHNNKPVISTPYRPMYRPIGNVYIIVNASGNAYVDIDIDVDNDFSQVVRRG